MADQPPPDARPGANGGRRARGARGTPAATVAALDDLVTRGAGRGPPRPERPPPGHGARPVGGAGGAAGTARYASHDGRVH